ncbi:glycosyltransferase [Pseudonocardia xinjiangensis]|uniref:Glycosyltransferase family 1 protein n=1 Tax=Pseudonocardia xinjiangensis TaxID=75289 RepID=A0ABX1RKU5_9PSEU|nr:glycosyltransferase [Pseudonocardia xinjiangensis]NMH80617.1 glycosyltransferase family 1 protein [Pseudonocardia xinjiangensis]
MRIVIVAVGTWGDVAPYTGLGTRLQTAGHEVAIAAHAPFEAMVRERGLGFRPLPMDVRDELGSAQGQQVLRTSPLAMARFARMYARHWGAMAEATEAATEGADFLMLSAMGFLGQHVAEGKGIPSAGVYLQPLDPTGEFPPWTVTTRSLGRWGNRAAARTVRTAGMLPFRGAVNDLRARLGLRPTTAGAFFRRLDEQRWPVFYGISPTVLRTPADWPPYRRVVGYWWPQRSPGWEPEPRLVDFLAAGPPPVFVSLGSMAPRDTERLGRLFLTAARRAGLRVVLQQGWGGLTGAGDDVLVIGDTPHDWLFPQMAAVVHHGGAGTTAAGLRAGVPAVPTPLTADQPFWAQRLVRLGVSPGALPFHRLEAGALADSLRKVTTEESFAGRAREVAAAIATEDGADRVLDALSSVARG